MHIKDNILLIRKIKGDTQLEFVKHFTNVSVHMQKSYESGKAQPSRLYIQELADLARVPEEKIRNSKLTKESLKRMEEKAEMVETVHPTSSLVPLEIMAMRESQQKLELGHIEVTVADYIKLQDKLINLQEQLTQRLLKEEDTNSRKMDFYADNLIKNMRADHDTMMGALDRLLGVQPGTLEKESDSRMTGVPAKGQEIRSQRPVSGMKGKR